MTKTELGLFRQVARTLATRLRVAALPTDEELRALGLALEDIPFALIEAAADRLWRTSMGFWPRPMEWRQAVDGVQQERYEKGQLRPSRDGLPDVCCDDCEDTGWRLFHCAGLGRWAEPALATDQPCDRSHSHAAHRYVRPCVCRYGNPRYQANHTRPPVTYAGAGHDR